MKLKFRNGTFRILILADIHLSGREWNWTRAHIEAAIDCCRPDLAVLLGDNITGRYPGADTEKINTAIKQIRELFGERKIPFTLVFGNHDHEGLCEYGFTERSAKKHILSLFKECPFCLAEEGEKMTGVGNYNRLIYDSAEEKPVFNLWFMDSNPYADEAEGGGYGYVHSDQLRWYEEKGEELKRENGGRNIPSFIFQHIIVPEAYEMLNRHQKREKGSVRGHGSHRGSFYSANPEFIKSGEVREGPCPPDVKGEQFNSWLKRGDIIGAFFGHDHINDFSGEYKGIRLHQVPSTGFYSYGNRQGSRVVTLFEDDLDNYETKVLRCADICKIKIRNPFIKNHGLHEWLIRWRPVVYGIGAGVLFLLALKLKGLLH